MGADDLVLKPFSFAELSARVRALRRRGGLSTNTVLCVDALEPNRLGHSVKRAARAVESTPKEFAPLEYLMRNAGQEVTCAQIIEHVWNLSFDTMTNVVDVYISYSSAQVEGRAMNRRVDLVILSSNVESITPPMPPVISGAVHPHTARQ